MGEPHQDLQGVQKPEEIERLLPAGGTTIAAVHALECGGLRAAVMNEEGLSCAARCAAHARRSVPVKRRGGAAAGGGRGAAGTPCASSKNGSR